MFILASQMTFHLQIQLHHIYHYCNSKGVLYCPPPPPTNPCSISNLIIPFDSNERTLRIENLGQSWYGVGKNLSGKEPLPLATKSPRPEPAIDAHNNTLDNTVQWKHYPARTTALYSRIWDVIIRSISRNYGTVGEKSEHISQHCTLNSCKVLTL